jgi:hypothetical protein
MKLPFVAPEFGHLKFHKKIIHTILITYLYFHQQSSDEERQIYILGLDFENEAGEKILYLIFMNNRNGINLKLQVKYKEAWHYQLQLENGQSFQNISKKKFFQSLLCFTFNFVLDKQTKIKA